LQPLTKWTKSGRISSPLKVTHRHTQI